MSYGHVLGIPLMGRSVPPTPGFDWVHVIDFTQAVIPEWELRSDLEHISIRGNWVCRMAPSSPDAVSMMLTRTMSSSAGSFRQVQIFGTTTLTRWSITAVPTVILSLGSSSGSLTDHVLGTYPNGSQGTVTLEDHPFSCNIPTNDPIIELRIDSRIAPEDIFLMMRIEISGTGSNPLG